VRFCRQARRIIVGCVRAQGWYRDPYLLHGERWISDGQPTPLVRDQGIESREAPPPGEPAIPAGSWLAAAESRAPWPSPSPQVTWQAPRGRYAPVMAIVTAAVGQLVIWAAVYGALAAWFFSQAWPPNGPGSG
jgi:hypothetical protein